MTHSFLDIDLKPHERVLIGGQLVTVELLHKSGQLARLRIGAPPQVPIKKELQGYAQTVARMTG